MLRLLVCLGTGLLAIATAAQDTPVIRKVPIARTNPTSGTEMFKNYCAACHGALGKGDGPAAPALKNKPTDLTTMSVTNGGKFPANKVYVAIQGDSLIPAHGSKDMPVWGDLMRTMNSSDGEVKIRLSNLTKYVESLQGGK